MTQLKKEIIAKIMKKVVEADHFDLSQKYEEWFVGTDREAYDFLDVFSNSLYEMDMKHREFILLNNEWGSTSEFSFDSFDLSLFKNVKVSTTDDIMMFDFSEYNFPAADKTLAMANYFRPYKRYSLTEMKQVTSYSLVQVQISPDFPNKYLSRNYSPFSSIDCFIIKRR